MKINKLKAISIARKHHGPGFKYYDTTAGALEGCLFFKRESDAWGPDDVWCVTCSLHPEWGYEVIQETCRAILISKKTGKVLFDDEISG